eukprot:167388_1
MERYEESKYWFWLAISYKGKYEWTIDDDERDILRYCTLPDEQQKAIKNGDISYLDPYSCTKWKQYNMETLHSSSTPNMTISDCDRYSAQQLITFIASSSGYSVFINDDGQIIIDTNGDTES